MNDSFGRAKPDKAKSFDRAFWIWFPLSLNNTDPAWSTCYQEAQIMLDPPRALVAGGDLTIVHSTQTWEAATWSTGSTALERPRLTLNRPWPTRTARSSQLGLFEGLPHPNEESLHAAVDGATKTKSIKPSSSVPRAESGMWIFQYNKRVTRCTIPCNEINAAYSFLARKPRFSILFFIVDKNRIRCTAPCHY